MYVVNEGTGTTTVTTAGEVRGISDTEMLGRGIYIQNNYMSKDVIITQNEGNTSGR